MTVKAIRRAIPTFFLAGLVVYFGYHGLSGDQGVLAWAGYKTHISELEGELKVARAERRDLEDRAARLRESSLDLDLVDKRAREILNFANPDDYVVRLEADASHVN